MVTLYSTGCPKCRVIKDKLNKKNIQYTEINDMEEMQKKGFISAPMLEVDGKIYNFRDANRWIMNYEGE